MENQLDYAQMLEIPVSTVSVVKKKSLFKRKAKAGEDLKEQVVESVNERADAEDTLPRADFVQSEDLSEPPAVAVKKERDGTGMILIAEAVAACLIAGGIFVTNIFLPNSAINTLVGSMSAVKQPEAVYRDFKLTPVVSELSDTDVTVTNDGVLCFTGNTAVYPVCAGKISAVNEANGLYTVQIEHSSTFTSVVTGLSTVYAAVGDKVQANIPYAYSNGENEVRVSMYDGETLLNCYTLSGVVPVWNS